ncbi:MAG: hypothetical protein U0Q16_35505 [Bryobacteraceae bacterium]
MPSYIQGLSEAIARAASRYPDLIQFGENILQGSRICGLTRSLTGRVINVGNCENTHVGAGFGVMMRGGRAALYMKQLDFLLLGVDQIVNTWNLLRAAPPDGMGSFTIVAIVCDQGWQGPQSSFNALADLCSLARVDAYLLTDLHSAGAILASQLGAPGFRILALSQRQFGAELLDVPVIWASPDYRIFQYAEGDSATVACFNFSLPQGLELVGAWEQSGRTASLYSIHPAQPYSWGRVVEDAARTGRLIAIDDGKGANSLANRLAAHVARIAPGCRITIDARHGPVDYTVNEDRFEVELAW